MTYKINSIEVGQEVKQGDTFDVGSKVPRNGKYVCVPCGYQCNFEVGRTFPRCFKCLEGKKNDGDDFFRDLGLWEFIENV